MEGSPGAWVRPEPVVGPAPGLEFASHGARLVAYIVDTLIQGFFSIAVFVVSFVVTFFVPPLAIVGALAFLVIAFGYFPYFWTKTGQTPGMQVMGIKVVRDVDGGPITSGQAILRLVGYWVSGLVFYLGFIWIFIDARRRGWHDLIAGTVVVSGRSDRP